MVDKLVLEVNQGCPRGYAFTIKQKVCNSDGSYNIVPLDLSGMTIEFLVKKAPYYKLPNLIAKYITESSSLVDMGQITDAKNGQFFVQITQEESVKLPPGEYALVIRIVDKDTVNHISGDGNNYAIYRVCYQ